MKFDIVDSLSTLKLDTHIWVYITIVIILLYAILYKIDKDLVSFDEKEGLNIISVLTCPIKILLNLPLCAYYYALDCLFGIIWLVIWVLIYIFIYLPLLISFSVLIWLSVFPEKWIKYPSYVLITKKRFFLGIESFVRLFSPTRFLYRNKSDMKKCYCAPYIKYTIYPLDKYSDFAQIDVTGSSSSNKNVSYFIPVIVLVLLYIANRFIQ
jgi:hypothetical protein